MRRLALWLGFDPSLVARNQQVFDGIEDKYALENMVKQGSEVVDTGASFKERKDSVRRHTHTHTRVHTHTRT